MTNRRKWKIGIIGAGGITEAHLEAIKEEPRAEVVAIADVSAEMASYRAKRHDIPQVFTEYEAMLQESDTDAIIVCVPNYLHAEATKSALAAGKHLLCEKPMAMNAQEATEMIEAAKKADKILMVAQNNRFRSDSLQVKTWLKEGKLGNIYHAKTGWVRRNGIPGWGSWFTQKEWAGGGPLIDIGVHMLDLTLWLLDHPKPVSVLGQTYAQFGPHKRGLSEWGRIDDSGKFDVEDMAVAMITFENGLSLTLDASWASHIEEENVFLQLYGQEGGASLRLLDNQFTLYHEWNGVTASTEIKPKPQKERVLLFRNFIDAIEGKAEVLCTPEQALYINRLIEAIYASAQKGEAVRFKT
ncbi:Gfo/Idh/MocA family protein [Brevibacillus porteri]|uniref:Gfo/Idh/MocA family oxidoreductase n=1 Tax=Brevibacillus porteri TaxID=2126350 RepID=A0ABX5FSR1_9BACL|nr:Gfo/Idh/MocA family oxidoreductase [Brevibacillus porteri]MED1799240.1 Gfo/Idh/MocA family oxidoreductase [Brevibacillus porteri]MED2132372.1 Gfo/Idh/MocA family oxidoreductase [Brevibacillus porteri]MED2744456.1 Gfo/Idh/MocA family oxidoreductase [Brevibacillus porteri]MED2814900.1 Gfo/Idh/MocA family oxidoreductase [Brevibacillus porteri]MED2895655.1 Gfo/Idh/MocA family oxidoreductase [Brevibacillus porteri]